MKLYGYSVTFADGTTNTGINVKAESERKLIKKIVNDRLDEGRTIVSITVLEVKR